MLDHHVRIVNAGNIAAVGAHLVTHLPPELDPDSLHWTCVADAGSSCGGGASGNGSLPASIDLGVDGSVSFVLSGQVLPGPSDALALAVQAHRPAGNDGSDGSDEATTTIVVFRDGFEPDADTGAWLPAGVVDAAGTVMLDVAGARVWPSKAFTWATAAGGAFRVEGVEFGGVRRLRLVARSAGRERFTAWSTLPARADRVAIGLAASPAGGWRLLLAGAADDLELALDGMQARFELRAIAP